MKTKKVKLRCGAEVYDSPETRFVKAWEKRTEGKVWDKTVGKYGAWVSSAEGEGK